MRFSRLADWLGWQEQAHPRSIDLGLERVTAVWRRLRPQGMPCAVITVGGTNGKGSCVTLLDAILSAAGYRTGRYLSPHLLDYRERIQCAGQQVSEAALCATFERIDQARGDISLTYFEFGTLAALDLFAQAGLDIAILEVGLGGRLDAVNLLDADLALISSVGMDHIDWLGDSLDQIAREKAGILRRGRPAIIGQPDAPPALMAEAERLGARPFLAGRDFGWERDEHAWHWQGPQRRRRSLPIPSLRGDHQLHNAAAVLMALDCLEARFPVGQDALRQGLLRARLPGRFQVQPGPVTWILDVAHNVPASRTLGANLRSLPPTGSTHAVFGCLRDKDASGILAELSHLVQHWYLAHLDGARAMPPEQINQALHLAGVDTLAGSYPRVADALVAAEAAARPGDRILVTGSFLTVADALRYLEDSGRLDPL